MPGDEVVLLISLQRTSRQGRTSRQSSGLPRIPAGVKATALDASPCWHPAAEMGLGVNFGWAGSEWPSPAPWDLGTAPASSAGAHTATCCWPDPARLRLTPLTIWGRALKAGAVLLPLLAGEGENCFFFSFFFIFPPLLTKGLKATRGCQKYLT